MADPFARTAITGLYVNVSIRDLRRALKTVRAAVPQGATAKLALAGIRIDSDGDLVHFTTTDLDLGIRTSFPNLSDFAKPMRAQDRTRRRRGFGRRHHQKATHAFTGTAIVNFGLLDRFLKGRHSEDSVITLALTDEMLCLQADERSIKLRVIDPDQWPDTSPYRPMTPLITEAATAFFKTWWDRLVPACADDETTRLALTGLNLRWRNDTLEIAATDTYRMHILELTTPPQRGVDVIFPPSALKVALDVSKTEQSAPLSLWVDDSAATVEFRTARTTVRARTIEGEFPPITSLVPNNSQLYEFQTVRIFDAKAVVGLLEDIARLVKSVTPIKLQFDGSVVTAWVKEEHIQIDGDKVPGLAIEAPHEYIASRWFSVHRLADIIRATGDKGTLFLRPHDQLRAVVLRNGEFTGLLMPVRPNS